MLTAAVQTEESLLIELCGALVPADGFCRAWERGVDVSLRSTVNALTLKNWYADKRRVEAAFHLRKRQEAC